MQVLGVAHGLKVAADDEQVNVVIVPGTGFFDRGVYCIESTMALERGGMLADLP